MTLNNARIVKCPYCGTAKELMSLNSGNNINATYWSDYKQIAPMLPKISPVQKCAECGKYYLEYKQESEYGEKQSFETGKLTYWEWKEAYQQFCVHKDDITDADILNIRGWLVQSYNDHFYRGQKELYPSKEEHDFIAEVMFNLINTIDWSENLDPLFPGGVSFGDPAQEKLVWSSKLSPVLKAELYREAGEFQKCKELLLSFQGKSIDTFDARLCYCIMDWMDKGETKVFKFYDDREEKEKTRREKTEQRGFKICSNGHYFRGDKCPYCKSAPSDNYSLEYGHNVFNNPATSDDGVTIFSVKVCPNGHGYDVGQTCPFCGNDIVSEIVEQRAGFTLVIADMPFVKKGVPVSCDYAEVDGNTLTGDLCMRIEYTDSFKYAYYISQKGKGNSESLLINPTSHIKVTGDDFSDTYTGRDFYKMCDDLFEKKERPQSNSDKTTREYKQCPNGHYYQGNEPCPYCGCSQEEKKDSPKSEMSGNDISHNKDNITPSDGSLKLKRLIRGIGIVYYIVFLLLFGFVLYSFSGNYKTLKIVSPCLFVGYVFVFDLVVYKLLCKDDKDSGSFKLCPNGHYYTEDECPYCKSTSNTPEFRIVKVCHRGHGYAEKEQLCPFCGDKAVARTVKVVDPITCWSRDFCYKKSGTLMPLHYASVDGTFIKSENICLRVYYYNEFKYDYGVSEYGQYEHGQFLSVSPESIVLLRGEGFADTYTGKDFYKMCDDLFEEDESEKDERQQLNSNETTNEFKKCPIGHYYKGDECPYCKSMNIKNSITIGRSIENDVIVDDPLVTRIHCKIKRVGEDRYIITAFVTENGTYVNGKKLEGSMEIGPFNDVMMGKTHVQWLHHFAGPGRREPLGGDIAPF